MQGSRVRMYAHNGDTQGVLELDPCNGATHPQIRIAPKYGSVLGVQLTLAVLYIYCLMMVPRGSGIQSEKCWLIEEALFVVLTDILPSLPMLEFNLRSADWLNNHFLLCWRITYLAYLCSNSIWGMFVWFKNHFLLCWRISYLAYLCSNSIWEVLIDWTTTFCCVDGYLT
jgi:hypothetical protein